MALIRSRSRSPTRDQDRTALRLRESRQCEWDPYSTQTQMQPMQGPVNPFKTNDDLRKKNTLTGHAEETFISNYTFNNEHRKYQSRSCQTFKRPQRAPKGDASIVDGPNAYRGPFARYEREDSPISDEGSGYSDEGSETDVFVNPGPMTKESTSYTDDTTGETSQLHGEKYDYLGRSFLHADQTLDIFHEPGSQKNFYPKKLIHTFKSPIATHTKAITALRFANRTGHLLASSSADGNVKLWDAHHSREVLMTYFGNSKAISDIQFSADNRQLLSSHYDRTAKLWDLETGSVITRIPLGAVPHCITIHPDTPHEFVAGLSNNKICQWDLRTQTLVQEYDHHLGPVNTISWIDSNRRFVSTSDDRSLRAWEYGIPVPIKLVSDPSLYSLGSAAVHPSGKAIAYTSADNQVVIYSVADKLKQNQKKRFLGCNYSGHKVDVAISEDGGLLYTGDAGGYLAAYDYKTSRMVHKLLAVNDGGPCLRVAVHPQETSKVATAGLSGEIRYWD